MPPRVRWAGILNGTTGPGLCDRRFLVVLLLVTITFLNVGGSMGHGQTPGAHRRRRNSAAAHDAVETRHAGAVVAGGYLMFSWILRLTWIAHDPLATGIAAGTMLMLAIGSFIRLRGKPAALIAPALGRHVNLFGLMILAILNLRADVWVARAYGVTVAEAHNLQPIWIIPVLTLALIAWTAAVIALTKNSE
jgi:hypothetical protein